LTETTSSTHSIERAVAESFGWQTIMETRRNLFKLEARPEGEEMSASEQKVLTFAEREARKLFRQAEAEKAMTEYEKAEMAFHKNRKRMKAERLAREAAKAKRK